MANGGWHGTQEEWEKAEYPLPVLDPVFEQFACANGFQLSRNGKDWPERSLRKDMPLSSMIQVFRSRLDKDAWKVWLVCSEDRGNERYWKQQMIAEDISGDQLSSSISLFLEEGLRDLVTWNQSPEEFEFATKLGTAD